MEDEGEIDQAQELMAGERPILVPEITSDIPAYGGFNLMQSGAIMGRTLTTISPQAGQNYKPGEKVRLFFPRQHWTDMQYTFLRYDVTFTIDTPVAQRFKRWVRLVIAANPLAGTATFSLGERHVDASSVRIVSLTSTEAADVANNGSGVVRIGGVIQDGWGDSTNQNITDAIQFVQVAAPAGTLSEIVVEFMVHEPNNYHTLIQSGISSIVSTLRIMEAGIEIERIDYYGLLQRWLSLYTMEKEWHATNGILQGYFHDKMTGANINITGGSARTVKATYCVPLWPSAYWKQRYIPNPLMQEWQLELTLDTFANSAFHSPAGQSQTNAIATTWEITGMELAATLLEPKAWYQAMIFAKRQAGTLYMMMNTVKHHTRVPRGSNENIILTDKFESIEKIMWGIQLNSDENNLFADSGIARSILDPVNAVALREYRYKLGTYNYPDSFIKHINSLSMNIASTGPITTNTINLDFHSYQESLSTVQKFRVDNPGYTNAPKTLFLTPERYYGYSINGYGVPVPYDSDSVTQEPEACVIYTSFENDKGYVSGANTQASNVDIQVEMKFTNAIQQSTTAHFFLFYNQAIRVLESGSTTVYR